MTCCSAAIARAAGSTCCAGVVTIADPVGAAARLVDARVTGAAGAAITAAAAMITAVTDRFSRYDGYAYIDIPPSRRLCRLSLCAYN